MVAPVGFWSYVHDDDDAEGGRIADLARDLVKQMELLTGDSVELFLDRDDLAWGVKWQAVRDEGLASVAFFIAVITPRYFRSAECRGELQTFARKARDLGVRELVLPLIYVDVPQLHDPSPIDELITLIKEFQWAPWTELRLTDRNSAEYRTAVADLAQRLADANAEADRRELPAASSSKLSLVAGTPSAGAEVSGSGDTVEDAPGVMDLIAAGEGAMDSWSGSLTEIGQGITEVGEVFTSATSEIERSDRNNGGMAGRLVVTRNLAHRLETPINKVGVSANAFASSMHTVDAGVRALLQWALEQGPLGGDELTSYCQFSEQIRTLEATTTKSLASMDEMTRSFEPMERMSRDLRAPLRQLRQSLTVMREAQDVVSEWVRLLDAAGIDCSTS